MEIFFKLSGIISEIFLYTIFLYSKNLVRGFDLEKTMISDLGYHKKAGLTLHSGLIIYTILRFIFIGTVFTSLSLWSSYLILIIALLSFLSTVITSIVPISKNKLLHEISGYSFLIFSIIFIFLLGFYLLNKSLLLGLSSLIIALIIFLITLWSTKKKKLNGYFELNIFYLISLWDIIFTLKLFNIL